MVPDVIDPLAEYKNVYKQRFRDVCAQTFSEMSTEAQVDVDANRETCRRLYAAQDQLANLSARIAWLIAWCVIIWLGEVAGGVVLYCLNNDLEDWVLVVIMVAMALAVVLFFARWLPHIRHLKQEKVSAQTLIDELQQQAWQQMSVLNSMYDWDLFARMMTRTVPRLELDPYFTTQRLADLKQVYGWDDSFNSERSVIYSHSGLINGNPFVLCRTRKMEWGSKTYHGSITIHWTTVERDSQGKSYTRRHSEVLTASYTAPYPEYYEKTRLIYGNTSAPDLIFDRIQNGLADKVGSIAYNRARRRLRKLRDDLEHVNYAMMTDEEFEVLFDTSNRNDNQQHALLFTPIARQSIKALLSDHSEGYGDDFDFHKHYMINIIVSNHIQQLNLDMNPNQFVTFDYDRAVEQFSTINANYFRAFYFCLAPLLSVPLYQQIRPVHEIYGRDMVGRSAFWEHESLANCWGQDRFQHPSCVTNCILKTEQHEMNDGSSIIQVTAHGYRVVQHTAYISKYGGDGRWHDVPVQWDEYLPVAGHGQICMQEDNSHPSHTNTHTEHINHIHQLLETTHMDLYRRSIASKLV